MPSHQGYSIRVFRGLIAPASLKHYQRFKEADDMAVFRGLIAPASLKPGKGPFRHIEKHVFRGLIAPASLKRFPLFLPVP